MPVGLLIDAAQSDPEIAQDRQAVLRRSPSGKPDQPHDRPQRNRARRRAARPDRVHRRLRVSDAGDRFNPVDD
eukprot:gene5421-7172_t